MHPQRLFPSGNRAIGLRARIVSTVLIILIIATASIMVANAPARQTPDTSTAGLLEREPGEIGLHASRLKMIDKAVAAAIKRKEIPGAVVLVARRGGIGYFKAFGRRAVVPIPEEMTTDTIFDVASLTKVMATTPSIMILVERGLVRLDDKVHRYLPEFKGRGKEKITVKQLLTHYSGLRPDFDLSAQWEGYCAAMQELWKESPRGKAGENFVYSDLNFIALGEIVQRVSGKSLDVFAWESIYRQVGMNDTSFRPSTDKYDRIAPTESRYRALAHLGGKAGTGVSQEALRGEVHDPTAWRMGGVAGHAGLFSDARDIAVYAQMLLNGGSYMGNRVLSPFSVQAMTSPQSTRNGSAIRGLGWDIDSRYSAPRGDLLAGGFGHTGFTGTSLWIHPRTQTFIIILSSRLHPNGGGSITHLRGTIANIVASSICNMP